MKKDAFYFPHFSNARNDSKVVKLRRILGIEGYGLYFMLLEVLRDQSDFKYPIQGIEDLAYDWHISKEKIISVINDFDLFTIDQNQFFSLKFNEFMQPYLQRSERARIAINKRWNHNALPDKNTNGNTNVLPQYNDGNTMKGKESKRNESKSNEMKEDITAETKVSAGARFKKPDYELVLHFFIENGFQDQAQPYFDFYNSNGWKVGRNAMKDWQAAARNWMKRSETTYKPNNNGKHKPSFSQVAAELLRQY